MKSMERKSIRMTWLILSILGIFFLAKCSLRISNGILPLTNSSASAEPIEYTPVSASTLQGTLLPDMDVYVKNKCITSAPLYPIPSGQTIVMSEYLLSQNLSLFDLQTGQSKSLGHAFPTRAVSPDHMWLAYIDADTHHLNITDVEGKYLRTLRVPNDWRGVIRWVDNESLLIERFIDGLGGKVSSVLFNTTTDAQIEYMPDYPEIEPFSALPWWGNYS